MLALQIPAVVQNVLFISIYRVPRGRIQGKCNGVRSLTTAAKSAIHLHLRIMCEESTIVKKEPQQRLPSKALYHSELPSQNRRSCGGMESPSPGNKSWEKAEFFEFPRRKRIRQLGRRVNQHIFSISKLPSNMGLIRNRDDLDRLITNKRIGAYVGIDPTAPSLHVGHLIPLMALFWMYVHGMKAVSLVYRSSWLLRL